MHLPENNPKYNFRFAIIIGFYPDIDRSHHKPSMLIPQTAAHRGSVRVKRAERRHTPDEAKNAAQGETRTKQRVFRGQ